MLILLADDHPFYLDALERQITRTYRGSEVRSFTTVEGLCEALSATPADLVILDYSMSSPQGGESVRRVVELAGTAPVIVISGVANAADVTRCVAAGARGYMPKSMEKRVFADAVSLVLHGGTYLPIEFSLAAAQPVAEPAAESAGQAVGSLDTRDRELLDMIEEGVSNKEIARRLDV